MRIALYQPDIAQNTGTIMRMAACLGLGVDLILPAGFEVTDRAFRRSGLDYLSHVAVTRHRDWAAFEQWRATANSPRLVLLTTKADQAHVTFAFNASDILVVGRESGGVPEMVHRSADARIVVPMRSGLRSLNVAVATAIVAGEAMRQTGGFATEPIGPTN